MEIEYVEVAKIILPIIAIVISLLTIYFTRKNVRKQIRVNKLEEILEIIYTASRQYKFLFGTIIDMQYVKEKLERNEPIGEGYLNYGERMDSYLLNNKIEILRDRMARLQVLLSAYLPNKKSKNLRFKLITFAELHIYIYQTIFSKKLIEYDHFYKTGLPKPGPYSRFVSSIIDEIIKEMDLGYKNYSYEEYKKYRNNVLPKELEINRPLD